MDMSKPVGLMTAMRDFFGSLPGQNLQTFATEVRTAIADPKNRAFYIEGLEKNGYIIDAASKATVS